MLSSVKKWIHQDCRTEMHKLYALVEETKAVQNYAMIEAENKIKDLQEKLKKAPDGHAMTKWAEERTKEIDGLHDIIDGKNRHLEGLRAEIKTLQYENGKLQSQLDTLQSDPTNPMTATFGPVPMSTIPPFDESILEHRNMLLKKVDEQVLEIHKASEAIKQLMQWRDNDEKRISTLNFEIESFKKDAESSKKTIDDLKNQLKQNRSAFNEYKKNCKPRKNKKDLRLNDVGAFKIEMSHKGE